jgi:SAM-dependent methyltransferase
MYRWNLSDFATGYDAAAHIIHPRYLEIQDLILKQLSDVLDDGGLIVDLGGGSGRLLERILDRWPAAHGVLIDQSEPFLALAERRLHRFGSRATCLKARLQDDWFPKPRPVVAVYPPPNSPPVVRRSPAPPTSSPVTAIVSMSAIHHLEPAEKQTLYRRCYDLLAPGGVLLNGDEVRPESDDAYLAVLTHWADHMRQQMAQGSIPATFHENLHNWIDRNVTRFGQEKKSGDDCHESLATQLAYFRSAGFTTADSPWQQDVWALLRAVK